MSQSQRASPTAEISLSMPSSWRALTEKSTSNTLGMRNSAAAAKGLGKIESVAGVGEEVVGPLDGHRLHHAELVATAAVVQIQTEKTQFLFLVSGLFDPVPMFFHTSKTQAVGDVSEIIEEPQTSQNQKKQILSLEIPSTRSEGSTEDFIRINSKSKCSLVFLIRYYTSLFLARMMDPIVLYYGKGQEQRDFLKESYQDQEQGVPRHHFEWCYARGQGQSYA
ncbi:hypothetical protein RHSIM_Rhsim13G0123800 [Rhododendron simsii]|uniref:Uncharacterized protein n=1 Tax=Rhododendron simsii TaxID=118357 RepID=A0A834FZA0_RHOSS|nr:hypothetical protein RHSIM_Rhsim13G0123800 [Rhododendron simsii]